MLIFSQSYYTSFSKICKQFHRNFTNFFYFLVKIFLYTPTHALLHFHFVNNSIKLLFFTNSIVKSYCKATQFPCKRFLLTRYNTPSKRRLLRLLKETLFKITFIDNLLLGSQFSFTFSLAINKVTFINPAFLSLVGSFAVKCAIFEFPSVGITI